jgi:hypothetical protein
LADQEPRPNQPLCEQSLADREPDLPVKLVALSEPKFGPFGTQRWFKLIHNNALSNP